MNFPRIKIGHKVQRPHNSERVKVALRAQASTHNSSGLPTRKTDKTSDIKESFVNFITERAVSTEVKNFILPSLLLQRKKKKKLLKM